MKRISLILLLTVAIAMGACSNFETSGNGAFDGYWQLERMDTLATGGSADMRERLVFWAVQHHLIELCDRHEDTLTYGPVNASVFYHFERFGDSLRFIADPLPVTDNRFWADPYADFDDVKVYGFSRIDEAFRVMQLDDDAMILRSQLYVMYFRKY
jgi:hypothetical protein